jgi:hypothetical protein
MHRSDGVVINSEMESGGFKRITSMARNKSPETMVSDDTRVTDWERVMDSRARRKEWPATITVRTHFT